MKNIIIKIVLFLLVISPIVYAFTVKAVLPDLQITGVLVGGIIQGTEKQGVSVYVGSNNCFQGFQNFEIKFLNRTSGQAFYKRVTHCVQGNLDFEMCPGNYDAIFTIDQENIIQESNEDNNTFESVFTIPGNANNCVQDSYPHINPQATLPDLEILDVYTKNTEIDANKIFLQLLNLPPASSTPKIKVSAPSKGLSFTGNANITGNVIDFLAPGSPWPSGTYQVIAEFDPNNEIEESNESNNIVTKNLSVNSSTQYQYNNKDLEQSFSKSANSIKAGSNINIGNFLLKSVPSSGSNGANSPLVIKNIRLSFNVSGVTLDNMKIMDGSNILASTNTLVAEPPYGYYYNFSLNNPIIITDINQTKALKIVTNIGGSGYLMLYMAVLTTDYPSPRNVTGSVNTRIDIEPGQINNNGNNGSNNSNNNSQGNNNQNNNNNSQNNNNNNPQGSNNGIITNKFNRDLKGKILLKVQSNGEAWYINPVNFKKYYLGRPDDAYNIMREQGVGISNSDLNKIPVGLSALSGWDSDADTLPDYFEDAMGLNKALIDSDGDGFSDAQELRNSYNPNGAGKLKLDSIFAKKQQGRILLQVQGRGEAWYVNPKDNKRYFLGKPTDAFYVMKEVSVGISNQDFNKLD